MPKLRAETSQCRVSKPVAVAEADGGVGHVPARDAAVDQQAAQGDDEGLQLEAGDEQAHGWRRGRRRCRMAIARTSCQGSAVVDHEVDEDDADQREHRAHRELDAAGDDDQPDADAEQAEEPDQVRHVDEVDGREEARVEGGRHRTDDQDQDEQAEVLLVHGVRRRQAVADGELEHVVLAELGPLEEAADGALVHDGDAVAHADHLLHVAADHQNGDPGSASPRIRP